MKTTLPIVKSPMAQAREKKGTLGEVAMFHLYRLISAENVEAIKFVLSSPKLKNTKIAEVCVAEVKRH